MFRSRVLAGATGLFLLTGCSINIGSTLGFGGSAKSSGMVVGDEPFAVKAGAAILAQGGSAVDAATAMYFAMAVTYPVAAGLGGGGICIVHDPVHNRTEEFDFLARDAVGKGAYAIPGNVRGFALMQYAHGAITWQKDIEPAEAYARTGFPISRALSARLSDSADVVRLDAGLAGEFMDESGHLKGMGAVARNLDLAETLAAIRTEGPDAFYSGKIGAKLVAYSAAEGGALTAPELAAYRASQTTPRVMRMSADYVFLPAAQTGAGAFAGALLDNVVRAESTPTGAKDAEASVIVATKDTLAAFKLAALPKDFGATGFAATDEQGQAVACAVTMNGPFGSGHTALGTGVTLARAPGTDAAGLAAAFLTPIIAGPSSDGVANLVGAGAGGPNGSAAIAYALARIARGDQILTRSDLHSTGVAPYDTVNAIVCSGDACAALPDPASHGLGAAVTQR